MALNYSLRPLFPAHLSEDNLVSPMRIADGYLVEGIPERNRDGFAKQWLPTREVQDRGDNMDWENVLPADPFGMDIDMNISSTVTAITGLLESLEYGACGRSEVGVSKGDCSFFAELNFLFSKAMDFHPFPGNGKVDDKVFVADMVDAHLCGELGHPFCDSGLDFFCAMDLYHHSQKDDKISPDLVDKFTCDKEFGHPFGDGGFNFSCTTDQHENHQKDDKMLIGDMIDEHFCGKELGHPFYDSGFDFACTLAPNEDNQKLIGLACDPDDGAPHPAFSFALAYLGVRDLLSVERVCKSLHFTVQNDPLLWKNLHIDQPLNDRITDDIVLQLTSRSQGNLQILNLVECQRITDDGLKRILESNPRLTKLSVPGCTRLSIDGVVSCLRAFKSVAITGIKSLRIGGLYGVTQEHFDELVSLLGCQNHALANHNKPLFYHRGNCYLSCEDERPIDIETCPRCQKLRLVYDCPAENCQGKDHATQLCRACTLCIPRCVQCGKCVMEGEYVENFCLELLCSACWKPSSKCQEKQDIQPSSSNAVAQEPISSCHG
uniref:F-box domain-containing protein n=1 Tax=Opuntia streptacantha TaxID=393608 RepID=A0A7C9F1I5_OPUST